MSALLKPNQSFEMEKIKIDLPDVLLRKMDQYMTYASFKSHDDLIQKAVSFVMEKDKGFKTFVSKSA